MAGATVRSKGCGSIWFGVGVSTQAASASDAAIFILLLIFFKYIKLLEFMFGLKKLINLI